MQDPYHLQRFIAAQDAANFGRPVYANACSELQRGSKSSHWMWFIFPQLKGLGSSSMAVRYAIGSLAEAQAYLQHPVLGHRLRECCSLTLAIDGRSVTQIFGSPDDLKLRSSMTLFSRATTENALFLEMLDKYFQGQSDPRTIRALSVLPS